MAEKQRAQLTLRQAEANLHAVVAILAIELDSPSAADRARRYLRGSAPYAAELLEVELPVASARRRRLRGECEVACHAAGLGFKTSGIGESLLGAAFQNQERVRV